MAQTKIREYEISVSPLHSVRSKRELAGYLGVSLKRLQVLATGSHYYSFEKNGKTIWAPFPELKKVQRKIHSLLSRVKSPHWLQSGRKGTSHVINARQHLKGKFGLTMDIKGYYESTRSEFVFRFFKYQMKQSDDVAWLCTGLVTRAGSIPRGSPASPLTSFWAYKPCFEKVQALTESAGAKMTLFFDDISSSGARSISGKIPHQVNYALKRVGLRLNPEKIRFYQAGDFKKYTGAMVSPAGQLAIPNRRRKVAFDRFVLELRASDGELAPSNSLMGRMNAERQIEPRFLSSAGSATMSAVQVNEDRSV